MSNSPRDKAQPLFLRFIFPCETYEFLNLPMDSVLCSTQIVRLFGSAAMLLRHVILSVSHHLSVTIVFLRIYSKYAQNIIDELGTTKCFANVPTVCYASGAEKRLQN